MKKKIIALFAIVAVFGLAIAAYAYTQTATATVDKASCCSKSDSCPMKSKAQNASMTKGEEGCCDCCGDSCPMNKGEAKATVVSASDAGKDCCDNCDCCKGKHETSA